MSFFMTVMQYLKQLVIRKKKKNLLIVFEFSAHSSPITCCPVSAMHHGRGGMAKEAYHD